MYRGKVKTGPGTGSTMSNDGAVVAWITKNELCVLPLGSDMTPVVPAAAAAAAAAATAAGKVEGKKKEKKEKDAETSVRKFYHKKRFTALAFHPHDYTIATGHENGVVSSPAS